MTSTQGLLCIVIMCIVTFAIRALPFMITLPRPLTERLRAGQELFPTLFLSLLVIYCLGPLFPLTPEALTSEWPLLFSSAVVLVLHLWTGRLPISMGVGVAVHLWLMNSYLF